VAAASARSPAGTAATLWVVAAIGRWGRVTPDGVVVPLELTHAALARVLGAARPTVTLAIRELERAGCLARRADGRWLLPVVPDAP